MPRRLVAIFLVLAAGTRAASSLEPAIALYEAHRYPEAIPLFQAILAAEPNNAAACHYLGLTLRLRGDQDMLAEAVKWLGKASTLEPQNATYLADYGGSSMLLAGRTRSIGAATRGRDAMEAAIKLDPANLDAREGLMRFYQEAPWPLGSSAKAQLQLEEIKRRDADRGTVLLVMAKSNAKDYAGAFKLCEEILARQPNNYTALYQYGRTASASGQNLVQGRDYLRRCLALTPPGPAQPTHANVWIRLGKLEEKQGDPAAARHAYQAALTLEPRNAQASAGLAALK